MIYLDNAATTKVCESAVNAAVSAMRDDYGNPSSLHSMGVDAERFLTETRSKIANILRVDKNEIYFTSGGTEGNNLAILGACSGFYNKGRIITTKIEHKSVINPFSYLEKQGFEVVYLPVDADGVVDIDFLKASVDENTNLVSVMYVNNESGSIQPLERISNIVRNRNPRALIHVDGVQGFCKIPFPKNVADIITLSGHKIHGPKGIGAIYIKKGAGVNPIVFGGGQEKNLRPGTENVPAIAALGAAIDEMNQYGSLEKIELLNQRMRQLLLEKVDGIHINSPEGHSPYVLNISIEDTKSEIILHSLEQEGVYVSNGSACSSNRPAPSAVLLAMGIDRKLVECSLRISFSRFNTMEEVEEAVDKIALVSGRIQKIIRR